MNKVWKRISTWITLSLVLSMFMTLSVSAQETTKEPVALQEIAVTNIEKYGNLVLEISGSDLLAQGYTYGDVITVDIIGAVYDMPIGANYSDVEEGNPVCRVEIDPESGKDRVILAINMGDLATKSGLAVKTSIGEEPGYRWDYIKRIALPARVSISMKEKGGYYDEYMIRQLSRSNERGDYGHLNDMQFANFRPVVTDGVSIGTLYRSSSPINPELGRNTYADAATQMAGVKTIMNLADAQTVAESYENWDESYYSSCEVIFLNLGVDFASADFCSGLAEGLRFFSAGEGPYLVHCTEGKDRAGFVSALLECLMGASGEEVVADYMTTYYNYYGVAPGSEQYAVIAESNIEKTLETAFGVENIHDENVDMTKEAVEYMTGNLGMTEMEVAVLWHKLGGGSAK